jgi:hypothetical protein
MQDVVCDGKNDAVDRHIFQMKTVGNSAQLDNANAMIELESSRLLHSEKA